MRWFVGDASTFKAQGSREAKDDEDQDGGEEGVAWWAGQHCGGQREAWGFPDGPGPSTAKHQGRAV